MILFFSGTGNSRYAAERVGKEIGDEVVSIKGILKSGGSTSFRSERPFVIVCPTYAWRIPRIVSDFLMKAEFSGSADVFFVLTCGDDIGNAGRYCRKLCDAKGLRFKGIAPVLMPENYIALYDVPEKTEIDRIMREADGALSAVSRWIGGDGTPPEGADTGYSPRILDMVKSSILNPIFYSLIVGARGFHVTDACISCGACAAVCPLRNVTLTNGRPVWGSSCTHCMACIGGCPAGAIEYKRHTAGKPRYFNSRQG